MFNLFVFKHFEAIIYVDYSFVIFILCYFEGKMYNQGNVINYNRIGT